MKRENVVNKVGGQKEKASKHSDSDSEMQAHVSVNQPNKGLAGCWFKACHHENNETKHRAHTLQVQNVNKC